jgi:hypothetical protein
MGRIGQLPEVDATDSRYEQAQPLQQPQQQVESTPAPLPEVKLPEQSRRAEDVDRRFAILAWNAGYNTVGKLEDYFELTHNQAYKLYNTIKEAIKQQQQREGERTNDEA